MASAAPPVANHLRSFPATAESGEARFLKQLDCVALQLHRELTVSQVALTAVNEGRTLLGCDRFSLAAKRRDRTELLAVSGQERIVTRSSLVRAMTELASVLMAIDEPFVFAGDLDALPPELREPILEYVKESGARRLEAFPLRKSLAAPEPHDEELRFETCGILLIESFQEAGGPVEAAEVQAFTNHVAVALSNAREHERSMTLGRRIVLRFFAPHETRSARRTLLTAAVILATIVVLGMMPVRYRVNAPGKLLPVRRHEVFAPTDGRVVAVLVNANQRVTRGDVLLRLSNERLGSELLTTRHELDEKQQLLATLEAQAGVKQDGRHDAEAIRLSGSISQTRIEIDGIRSRLAMLEDEARELEVRAPLDGTVTTFDPQRVLSNRPVHRGEPLLEVMDTSGPWELRLELPAKRAGHVLEAREAASAAGVAVLFAQASQPQQVFTGLLRTVSTRVFADADASLAAPVEVDVAIEEIPNPIAGGEVLAQIDCGRKPAWYVLFGDALDIFRSRLW